LELKSEIMTVLEALNVETNNQVLSEKNLILVGLDPTTIFTVSNNSTVELAKAYCFKAIVTQPDYGEDGLTVKYTRSYLITEANRIFILNGLIDEVIGDNPTVSDKSGLW